MSLVVFGATGGTGRALLRQGVDRGDEVKAFARDPAVIAPRERLDIISGDASDATSVRRAIGGGDAIVVTLGNSQSPFARLVGAARRGQHHATSARAAHGTSSRRWPPAARGGSSSSRPSGIGDTREQAPWLVKLFYRLLLREQMADKERQEPIVKASGLDWTIVQPVALSDKPPTGCWLASRTGATASQEISRDDVAAFILGELRAPAFIGATVTLSGAEP